MNKYILLLIYIYSLLFCREFETIENNKNTISESEFKNIINEVTKRVMRIQFKMIDEMGMTDKYAFYKQAKCNFLAHTLINVDEKYEGTLVYYAYRDFSEAVREEKIAKYYCDYFNCQYIRELITLLPINYNLEIEKLQIILSIDNSYLWSNNE